MSESPETLGVGILARIAVAMGLILAEGIILRQPPALVQAGLNLGSLGFDDAENCCRPVPSALPVAES